MSNTLKSNYI